MGFTLHPGVYSAGVGLVGAGAVVIWPNQLWIGYSLFAAAGLLGLWGVRLEGNRHVWRTRWLDRNLWWRFGSAHPSTQKSSVAALMASPQPQTVELEKELRAKDVKIAELRAETDALKKVADRVVHEERRARAPAALQSVEGWRWPLPSNERPFPIEGIHFSGPGDMASGITSADLGISREEIYNQRKLARETVASHHSYGVIHPEEVGLFKSESDKRCFYSHNAEVDALVRLIKDKNLL